MKLRTTVLGYLVAALAATATASAQTALDAPTLSVVDRGFYRITVQVEAGPSGAPAGFAIDWMTRADFDIYGWPEDEYGLYSQYCDFTGAPTLNIDDRSESYALGPLGVTTVQLGDLYDETGLYATYPDGLPPGTEYAVRVHAEGDVDHLESAYSQTLFISTVAAECTQGFWKTHPEVWPTGCLPMTLGNVSYTQAELLAIYNTPAAGNGLIFLAHQLITTKLNACNGSNTSSVAATIAAADALIGNLVIPPIGSDFLAPNVCTSYTETLDQYNNGLIIGVVNCPTPTQTSTWGNIKSLYH
jgi:hypothetical protein